MIIYITSNDYDIKTKIIKFSKCVFPYVSSQHYSKIIIQCMYCGVMLDKIYLVVKNGISLCIDGSAWTTHGY